VLGKRSFRREMTIHYALLSLLVACCAGVSFSGDAHPSQVKHLNISSCSGPDGCKEVGSVGSAKWPTPSATPALQAMPFAMPLLMLMDGFSANRTYALIDEHFGRIDTIGGVRKRIEAAVILIAICGYVLAALAIFMQSEFHAVIDHDGERAELVDPNNPKCPDPELFAGRSRLSSGGGFKPPTSDIEQEQSQNEKIKRSASSMSIALTVDEDGLLEMDLQDLIRDTGVSGLCVLPPWEKDPTTKWPRFVTVYVIHIQGLLLQGGLLFFMMCQLQPQFALEEHQQRKNELPAGVVFISIYIHFLNCAQDLPYSYQLLKHFPDWHASVSAKLLMGPILITDSVVVPWLVVFIGSLYIAIARSPVDVILNSVAVAFVKDIDNWILALISRASFFSGSLKDRVVRFPVDKKSMRQMLMLVCYIPVVPVISSLVMLWLALVVLKM